jgi:sugar/nucleoside kinase (ribokinase family)
MSVLRATALNGKLVFANEADLKKVLTEMEGKQVDVSIKVVAKDTEKTRMYAYYQAVLIPLTIRALTKDGFELVDEWAADYYLKAACAKATIYDKAHDKEFSYVLEKRAMNKDRLMKFLSDCVWLLEERHQIVAPDSELYKSQLRTGKNFKSQKNAN